LSETETDCYAWALLDNHFHLLLQPKQRTLAEIMRRLLTGYAVVFNLRHHLPDTFFKTATSPLSAIKTPIFWSWCGTSIGTQYGRELSEILRRWRLTLGAGIANCSEEHPCR
jgi:hypothetical protein